MYGWKTGIAEKANGGDFWQGADKSVSEWVVPILNDQNGTVANAPYGLYSGSFSIDNVSAIRLLNGEAYLNKLTPFWNGTYYTYVPQQANDALSNADSNWFNLASNGIQFPPYMDKSPVTIYNDRLLMLEEYQYSGTNPIPTSEVQVQEYLGTWSGGTDLGFAYALPFFEHSHKCGDCSNTTYQADGTFVIKI